VSKKKRQRKKNRKRPERSPTHAAPTTTGERYRGGAIWRDVLKGFLFILIVLSIKFAVERTTFGKHLELMSYNLLQTQLSAQPVPVTIVDISDLATKDFIVDGTTVTATPREPLKEMIKAIAGQKPKAIGIDVDFSPDESGYILPTDPDFFQFCLDIGKQQGVPVFLGIKRTLGNSPDEWLGSEAYENLAANILVPHDSRRMVDVIQIEEETVPGATGIHSTGSRAMSALLADAYGKEISGPGRRLHSAFLNWSAGSGLIERLSEKQLGPGLSVQDFLVDYGPLESIETIRTTDAAVLENAGQTQRLQGKVVLMGDATLGQATDTFLVPARDQPYPGVFLHACAAYTLIKAPLYELTWKGHLAIDVLLSGVILAAIVLMSFHYRDQESRERATHRLRGAFTLLVVLAAIVIGVLFVRITRIMWDDFFLALSLLIFHPSIERQLEGFWNRFRKLISATSNRLGAQRKERHG
jgi:CHASE2 domain-containing sensor protein